MYLKDYKEIYQNIEKKPEPDSPFLGPSLPLYLPVFHLIFFCLSLYIFHCIAIIYSWPFLLLLHEGEHKV